MTALTTKIKQATYARLIFSDQTNGIQGKVIGLGLSRDPFLCPVKSITQQVIHPKAHNGPHDVPLA